MKHRLLFLFLLLLGTTLSVSASQIWGKLSGGGKWIYIPEDEELFIDVETLPDYGFVTHQGGVGDPLGPETKGEKCDVTDAPWCAFAKTTKVIIFSNKITHIGANAFRGFTEVVKVSFDPRTSTRYADELIYVGDYAFEGCTKCANLCLTDNCILLCPMARPTTSKVKE